jgi:hypothetical protein
MGVSREERLMVDTDLTCPVARDPATLGIGTEHPGLGQLEGAHLLANAARPFLTDCGFAAEEVLHWALSYIADQGSGDVETFVAWIHDTERCHPEAADSVP